MMGGLVVEAGEEVTGEIGARPLGCIESIYTTKMIALLMHASIILYTFDHYPASSRLYPLSSTDITQRPSMTLLFARPSALFSPQI